MDKIFNELNELKKNSYCKYSNFRVASIIYLDNGTTIKGVNVENAAYGATICAERTAITQLITQGFTGKNVKSLALYTDSNELGSPCGECRQVMAEHLNAETKLLIFNRNGFVKEFKLIEFIPYLFTL